METDIAQLSSIAAQVEELASRVATIAEGHRQGGGPDLAAELDEIERSLRAGGRRLDAVLRDLS